MSTPFAEIDDVRGSLTRSAHAFATHCHAHQRRTSDGAPFIEHPLEVARLVRDAGCSDDVIAAALLHDVLEDTDVGAAELRARFGDAVADLVQAVSDNPGELDYRVRKQRLRDQVRAAGRDVALLFAADKIAKVRELPDRVQRNREADHDMRLEHYRESLEMLQRRHARHPLVRRLAIELARVDRARLSAR